MPAKKTFNFKEAFERLERIVTELESGDADVEEAMTKYAEGLALLEAAKARLADVEAKAQELGTPTRA